MKNKKSTEDTDEILSSEKQRVIIESIVTKIYAEAPGLYYNSTMEIAHYVIEHIKKSKSILNSDKELVENLTPEDIQHLLSYNSNCC